jgi:uncharacterized protein YgbK (DUF1537 family)
VLDTPVPTDGTRRMIVLDDDPTGTQTIADIPVLTSWAPDDIRWALEQGGVGFFILTNSRSLSAPDAAERVGRITEVCETVAGQAGIDIVFASRGDSTLRGHFPLETDVITTTEAAHGRTLDAVILMPAYVDAGRITVDAVHLLEQDGRVLPVGDSEFAKDATFGYRSSDLRDWVEEKSAGRILASAVSAVTLRDIRAGGVEAVAELLATAEGVIAVDAVTDEDVRVVAAAVIAAETRGRRFVYRCGPSFIRGRFGQIVSPPLAGASLRAAREGSVHGLVIVGSHVGLTTRQLDRLMTSTAVSVVQLDVGRVGEVGYSDTLAAELSSALAERTTVLATSRAVVTGRDEESSLAMARAISAELVAVVRAVCATRRPAFIVAKGGITSSDIATEALGIRRALVRGTVLPGIVSLWEPADGVATGIPYVVFAGNVGDDDALAQVVGALEAASRINERRPTDRP